jgi:hypothetical protein
MRAGHSKSLVGTPRCCDSQVVSHNLWPGPKPGTPDKAVAFAVPGNHGFGAIDVIITQPGPGANRRAFRGRFRIIMYPVPVPASAIPHPPEAIHRTVNSTGTFDNSELYTPDLQNNIQIAITIHLCQFL